jgi:hypothetical protein
MHEPWATIRFRQDESNWWWGADWWERGRMPVVLGHDAARRLDSLQRAAELMRAQLEAKLSPARRGARVRKRERPLRTAPIDERDSQRLPAVRLPSKAGPDLKLKMRSRSSSRMC